MRPIFTELMISKRASRSTQMLLCERHGISTPEALTLSGCAGLMMQISARMHNPSSIPLGHMSRGWLVRGKGGTQIRLVAMSSGGSPTTHRPALCEMATLSPMTIYPRARSIAFEYVGLSDRTSLPQYAGTGCHRAALMGEATGSGFRREWGPISRS